MRLALTLGVWALVVGGLDRWFGLEFGWRLTGLCVVVGLLGWQWVAYGWRWLRRPLDDEELALAVERADPSLGQRLISAVQLGRHLPRDVGTGGSAEPRVSQQMVHRVLAEADEASKTIRFARGLDDRRARRVLVGWLLAAVSAAVALRVSPDIWTIWAQRWVLLQDVPWPSATQLRFVVPGSWPANHPAGSDLVVEVLAEGEVPREVNLEVLEPGAASGQRAERFSMVQLGGAAGLFRKVLSGVRTPLTLKASGGDGTTLERQIQIVARPRLVEIAFEVEPPGYTGKGKSSPTPAPGLVVPQWSRLVVRGRCDQDLQRVWIEWTPMVESMSPGKEPGSDARVAASPGTAPSGAEALEMETPGAGSSSTVVLDATLEGPRGFVGAMTMQAPGELKLFWRSVLDDGAQLAGSTPIQLPVDVIPDRPPEASLEPVGIRSMVTTRARIPLLAVAGDDHGLTRVALHGWLGAEEDRGAAIGAVVASAAIDGGGGVSAGGDAEAARGPREWDSLDWVFDLENQHGVPQVGHTLVLTVAATDGRSLPGLELGPQEARSSSVILRVVADAELVGDLQRRMAELAAQLERMLVELAALRVDVLAVAPSRQAAAEGGGGGMAQQVLLRRLGNLAPSLGLVADRLGGQLDEYANNRLLPPERVAEMRAGIPIPLQQLARRDAPELHTLARRWLAGEVAADRELLQTGFDQLAAGIRAVVERMQQGATLTAVVEELREVIRLQGAVLEAAEAELQAVGEDIFGDAPPGGGK